MNSAKSIWKRFANHPGARVNGKIGIATENAVRGIQTLVLKRQPASILEIGAGIGTLTFAVLDSISAINKTCHLTTVENNSYCRSALSENLQEFEDEYEVVSSVDAIPDYTRFDLIIVDGGSNNNNDLGFQEFPRMLAEGGCIFVEGARFQQREYIRRWYKGRDFIFVSVRPHSKELISPDGRVEKNKPYHTFFFEPSVSDRWFVFRKSLKNALSRVARRITDS